MSASGCALMRYLETRKSDSTRLISDPFAAIFLTEDRLRQCDAPLPSGQRSAWLTRLTALREKYIDDFIVHSIEEGIRQLVLLGAGYDARALRMPGLRDHEVLVFEIDQPFMVARKKARLKEHFKYLPAHLRFVGLDFYGAGFDALIQAGYNVQKKSLWVAQALSYYLNDSAMKRIFGFFITKQHAGSKFIFDYVDQLTMEQVRGGLSYSDMISGSRPFSAEPDALAAFLQGIGYRNVTSENLTEIEQRYKDTISLPVKGWYVADCLS